MKKNKIILLIALFIANMATAQFICRISPKTKQVGDEITKEKRNSNDSAIEGDYRIDGNGWILLPDHTGGLFIENLQINELLWVLRDINGNLGIEITSLKDELNAENKLQAEKQIKFLVNIKSTSEIEFFDPQTLQTINSKRTKLIPGKVYSQIKTIDLKYVPRDEVQTTINTSEKPQEITQESGEQVYNTAGIDIKPEFNGGMEKFYKFIGKNFITPKEEGLRGKIFVSFVVEKDGSLTNIKVIKDLGFGTGEEAVRVLSICPKWKPGEIEGQKVRVLYSLPINIESE